MGRATTSRSCRGPGESRGPAPSDYFHHDANGSVIAVSDDAGQPVERTHYEPFGEPSFFDADGNPLGGSAIGNTRLWRGWLWETGAGLNGYLGFPSSHGGSISLVSSGDPRVGTVFHDPRAGRNITRFGTRAESGWWHYVLNRGGDGNATGFVLSPPDTRRYQDFVLVKFVDQSSAGADWPRGHAGLGW